MTLLAGGLSGSIAKSSVAPLDRVKILFQVLCCMKGCICILRRSWHGSNLPPHTSLTSPLLFLSSFSFLFSLSLQTRSKAYPSYTGVMGTLSHIWNYEGVRGLFRGNWSNVVRIFPYGALCNQHSSRTIFQSLTQRTLSLAAIQFATHSKYKQFLRSLSADGTSMMVGGHFIAGSAAGASAVIVTYPLDLVRGRLAFQGSTSSTSYNGIIHAIRTIILHEGGVRTLYSGLGPTLVGIVPYAGINFYTYETQKAAWVKWKGKGENEMPTPVRLMFGALAGATGQTLTYPIDVVRRRMQIAGMPDTFFSGGYKGTWDGLRKIQALEGTRSLFRGISLNYLKVAPMVGISFATFDWISHRLGIADARHGAA